MSHVRNLLFLLTSRGRSRLVRWAPQERGFVTILRLEHATPGEDLARRARQILAQGHMEGLVVVAPPRELAAARASLDDRLVVVGAFAADLYEHQDGELAPYLERALHAPSPDR